MSFQGVYYWDCCCSGFPSHAESTGSCSSHAASSRSHPATRPVSTNTTHQSSVSPKCSETLRSEILESLFCLFNFLHITIYPAATSCLGRAITFASIVVKKINTYYISFNISQAWYSSKNHLTLDVQWPILAGPGLVFRIFRIFTINNFVESSPSTTLSNLQHQQLCRKCRIKQKIFNFQSCRWIRWRLEKIHCINIGGLGSNQLTKC